MDPILLRLNEALDALREEAEAIFTLAEKEKRSISDDDDKRLTEIKAERERIDREIVHRKDHIEAKRVRSQDPPAPDPTDDPPAPDPEPGPREGEFRTLGDMLNSVVVAARSQGSDVDPRLSTRAATGLSEGVPSDGGFLVQEDFSATLLERVYEIGQISSRVDVIPISATANKLVMNGIDEDSRVTGSRFGGIRAYWADEAETKTASAPKFRQISLTLRKIIGLVYATDELLEDTVALEGIISRGFSSEINFLVEDSILNGDGAGKPLGVLNSGCLVTVTKETGQLANSVVYENIIKMWSRMWARSRPSAIWLINQDVEPELFNLGITVGTGGTPAYLPPGGLSASPFGTLFGRPVIPVEYCATLGTVGDIVLADFATYLMIDKGGIQSASSIHVRFLNDESVFRFVYRVDGQPSWFNALTPFKGTNTLSPFVALATRA